MGMYKKIIDLGKNNLQKAQQKMAELADEYTDDELAELWEMPVNEVRDLRVKLGIEKDRSGVRKIQKLEVNPFTKREVCYTSGIEFSMSGYYTVEELLETLHDLNVFKGKQFVQLKINKGGDC